MEGKIGKKGKIANLAPKFSGPLVIWVRKVRLQNVDFRIPGNKSKRGKIGKIAKFGSKYFRTTGNKSKKGKIGKIAKFGSRYFRTTGNKGKRGKIGKIEKFDQNIPGPMVIRVREVR